MDPNIVLEQEELILYHYLLQIQLDQEHINQRKIIQQNYPNNQNILLQNLQKCHNKNMQTKIKHIIFSNKFENVLRKSVGD